MKNIQTHVYIPEDQMQAIRIAAKSQVRSPQNLLTYLLLSSPNYQKIVQEYSIDRQTHKTQEQSKSSQ